MKNIKLHIAGRAIFATNEKGNVLATFPYSSRGTAADFQRRIQEWVRDNDCLVDREHCKAFTWDPNELVRRERPAFCVLSIAQLKAAIKIARRQRRAARGANQGDIECVVFSGTAIDEEGGRVQFSVSHARSPYAFEGERV